MAQISLSASINSPDQPGLSVSISGDLPEPDVQKVRDLIQDLTIKITSPARAAQ